MCRLLHKPVGWGSCHLLWIAVLRSQQKCYHFGSNTSKTLFDQLPGQKYISPSWKYNFSLTAAAQWGNLDSR